MVLLFERDVSHENGQASHVGSADIIQHVCERLGKPIEELRKILIYTVMKRYGMSSSESEDVVQELFASMLDKPHNFEEIRNQSLLLVSIRNIVLQKKRKILFLVPGSFELDLENVEELEDNSPHAKMQEAQWDRAMDVIRECLRILPDPGISEAFDLFLLGYSCAEIAELQSVPKGTVLSRCARARKYISENLRHLFREIDEDVLFAPTEAHPRFLHRKAKKSTHNYS